MSKRNKVLIVERTLLSLGIDHIRHSRVGTVEQRGISGGQRKRVNVGLEMVIDPSLLVSTKGLFFVLSCKAFEKVSGLRALIGALHDSVNVHCLLEQILALVWASEAAMLLRRLEALAKDDPKSFRRISSQRPPSNIRRI